MDPYLILGLSLGGMIILTLLIVGIAWRRCGCPWCFNKNKKRRKKRSKLPRLKVVLPRNHDRSHGIHSEPSSSAHKNSGLHMSTMTRDHTAGSDDTADSEAGINVQSQDRTRRNPEDFLRTTSQPNDNAVSADHFTPMYAANPETGEAISTTSLIDDLGRLTEEEALYQMGLLTGNHIQYVKHGTGAHEQQVELQRLLNLRRTIRQKKAAIVQAKVMGRISDLHHIVKASNDNYEILMQNLAQINPPLPAVLVAKEQFVSEILRYILTFVTDCFPRFRGHVEGFGSYFAGHSGSRCPDFDYQYMLHAFDLDDPTQIQVQENGIPGSYDITAISPELYEEWKDCIVQGNQLDSWKVLQKFKEAIFHTVQHVLVPSEATHGGLLEPEFSGIRGFNKAVCIQYTWRGEPLKIDLAPVLMAPKFISKRVLDDMNPELVNVLRDRAAQMGLDDLGCYITLHTGTRWHLSKGLLVREILQMFDDIPTLRQAKKALGLIREHLLRINELNMDMYYSSITGKLSEVIKYTHHSELIQYLEQLADRGQWELFVLLVKAAALTHPEIRAAACGTVFRNPEFHKSLPASLTWYCRDSMKAIMSAKSVLLNELLVDVYTNNSQEFHSQDSALSTSEVIRKVLEMFAEVIRRTHTAGVSRDEISKFAKSLKYDESIKPEEVIDLFVDLTDAVCGILCAIC